MGQGHSHSVKNRKRLLGVLLLTASYMFLEFFGGWLTNSLALMADAGHMLSDVVALGISFVALWLAQRPATPRLTFGYRRVEILAALINSISLLIIAGTIVHEAYERFADPQAVKAPIMFAIAMGGLIINLVGLKILSSGKSESLNIKGAWLHVLTDTLGSVGAAGSAVLIWVFDFKMADPIASILISGLVVFSAISLLRETLSVMLEGAPPHLDPEEVKSQLTSDSDVVDIHDFHLWTITSGQYCLSAHVITQAGATTQDVLGRLKAMLSEKFGIGHTTLQLENTPCPDSQTCN